MKKFKTQRGITLIALIITIIVMLILVAVTVTVALNGGLFKTAKEGTSQTELEKEKELLLEEVMGAIGKNGKVDFSKLQNSDMFNIEESGDGFWTVKINESGRIYTITERGSIKLVDNEGGGENDNPDVGKDGAAGLYSEDGTLTISWADLTTGDNPIIPVSVDGEYITITEVNDTNKSILSGKLVISNDITCIGFNAFYNCTNLTEIYIPNSITSIDNYAFLSCQSLNKVEIPSSVTYIGACAFGGCVSLNNVTIEDGIDNVIFGDWLFSGCTALTSITIPSNVVSIGESALTGCTSLTQVNVLENNSNYSSDNGVLYNKDKTTLICYPKAKTDSSFIIPNSVTNIGKEAFSWCTGLTFVTIPNSVTNIGDYAFNSCVGLTSITISSSNISVGEWPFTGVTTVYYAGYVEGIDYSSWGATSVGPLPSGS